MVHFLHLCFSWVVILMYIDWIGMIKEEGLCFLLKVTFPVSGFCFSEKTEIFLVELNLRKQKWLIFCCYNPHKHLVKDHLQQIKNSIDFYSKSYENIILIGDFNVEISDSHMDFFCAIYHLKSLIKQPTCYKNPEKPSCIDLILTNSLGNFKWR